MSNSDHSDKPQDRWLDRVKSALGLAEPASFREDLEDALQETDPASDITPKERALLSNVLGMRDVRVSDVMTPRARIIGISEESTLADLLDAFRASAYARMPVYGETLDDPKGLVHIRDLLSHLAGPETAERFGDLATRLREKVRQTPLLRPVLFVPPSTPALDLLVRMQGKRLHMALVIDEYGETDGLVSMEDLVEVIVGDINDEHDTPEPSQLVQLADGTIDAAAEAGLDEVSRLLGIDLSEEKEGAEVDSIGGFVIALAGHVPQKGETIVGPYGIQFDVLDAVPRQVRRLSIRPASALREDGTLTGSASGSVLP